VHENGLAGSAPMETIAIAMTSKAFTPLH
jgi:hypothetical protein